jgi:hypothetical protein
VPAEADPWHADFEIGEERAARVIEREFPELKPLEVRRVGHGWDNVASTLPLIDGCVRRRRKRA